MDQPTHIDLTAYAGTVSYQGSEGTCAENSLYNSLLYETNIAGSPFKIDRQLAYQNVLNAQGHPTQDMGTTMYALWLTTENKGLNVDTGIYGPKQIGVQPTVEQVTEAATHKISSTTSFELATQTTTTVAEIVDLLNKNQPVIFGFNLRQGFVDGTGVNSGTLLGGHSVEVIGYSSVVGQFGQKHDVLKVASWGDSYGLNGYYNLDMTASFGTVEAHRDIMSVDTVNGFNGINWSGDSNSVNAAELYNVILNRAPETGAFAAVSGWLNSGGSMLDIATGLLNSKEGQRVIPPTTSNVDFVNLMFHQIQGRAPRPAGLEYWTARLDAGGSRALMVVDMIHQTQDSAEWVYNIWRGTDPLVRAGSDWLYNRATASIDIGLHMQDTGDTKDHSALLASVLTTVTADPNSVQAALVGIPEALGHVILH